MPMPVAPRPVATSMAEHMRPASSITESFFEVTYSHIAACPHIRHLNPSALADAAGGQNGDVVVARARFIERAQPGQ
jgi:hypothetical protein